MLLSQTRWLTDTAAAQRVWGTVKGAEFDHLETLKLNRDSLENKSGAIHLHWAQ